MSLTSTTVVSLLLLFVLTLQYFSCSGDPRHPRLRLSHKELWELNRSMVFHGPRGFIDLQTVLLDEYQDRLFVGGRGLIYSLSLDHINKDYQEIYWPATKSQIEGCRIKGKDSMLECANFIRVLHSYNRSHLLACGTGAFDPGCAFIRAGRWAEDRIFKLESQQVEYGRNKCPFDPSKSCASTLVDGRLYIGLYTDFFGEDPAIFRSLGSPSTTRTEHDDRLLKEPKFVAAHLIADNDDRDDDKVYFFFTEKALEADGSSPARYSRVGRLCASDIGGQRVLVNKWSTFIKARLVCSVLGPNGIATHFDEMEDVFLLQTRDYKNPVIYVLFRTTSNVFQGFAVCAYHMSAVREAFNGPYAHKEGPEYHWAVYEGKVPYPRPGCCASQINAPPGSKYRSTKDYPDDVLRFVHSHPIMYQSVYPAHKRPVLLRTDGKHNLKQLVVDRVDAEDGEYDVLFIGTDAGIVLKIITIYNQETEAMEEVVLEELQVFKVPTPIITMDLSVKRQNLYIGSKSGIAQLRIHQCDMYGSACTDCCLARDPYCFWDGVSCTRYYLPGTPAKRRYRRQDIRHGDAIQQCLDQEQNGGTFTKTAERLLYGIEKNSTLLECSPRSPQAKVLWFVETNNMKQDEVKTDDRVIKTELGLLFLKLHRMDAGTYICKAREHGFTQTVTKIKLDVLVEEQIDSIFHKSGGEERPRKMPCAVQLGNHQGSRPWYKEFLQLIGYSNFQRVEEYCQKVWCIEKKRKKNKVAGSKWKYSSIQERKVKTRGQTEHRRAPRHALDT
ncbi:semaphorin-3E-like isoform X2 [Stegostoma tigrinum]|uniref:semaphorin-3E-like isoform X2 n=1 Tax=Stegostoma tigrinum TaxID=3053191 RepID=UPI00202B2983|nr:semaphorin-3E-like isoform X2 [Stegostoma tigrinum]